MAIVRLGKMPLRWCHSCDLPILERKVCGKCGEGTEEVKVTPPGDVRPAFHFDLEKIRLQIDRQFGKGTGKFVLPMGRVALLNRCPAIDRMDEVILGGQVIGAYVYDIDRLDFRFIPRMEAAVPIVASGKVDRGWIRIDKGAVKAISEGANALAPGVLDAHHSIEPGDEILILSPEGEVIAVGPARMSGLGMIEADKGVAVKSRWYGRHQMERPRKVEAMTLEDVLEANKDYLEEQVSKAKAFVKKVVEDHVLPVAVSYSGGKDSLATLLLVMESDIDPKVIFIDTGLELKETVDNVNMVCRTYELDLFQEDADEAFWDALPKFGPPGRDFRWCCKTCKLGPVAKLIKRHFPNGVLTFIGQRSYESMQRQRKGPVWRNPWVANQIGASPIQDWPGLLIWLFLFSRSAEVNPLYTAGHARIGCWLCPASDLGDMKLLEGHPDSERWRQYLEGYAKDRGLPDEWVKKALWRWKRPTKGLKRYESSFRAKRSVKGDGAGLMLHLAEGYRPCTGGISIEGAFNRSLDLDRVENFLWTVGKVERKDEGPGFVIVDGHTDVFSEGAIVVRGKDQAEVRSRLETVLRAILRAIDCVGCGVCLGRCPSDAISIVDRRAVIDLARCTSCGECSAKCPITDYSGDVGKDM